MEYKITKGSFTNAIELKLGKMRKSQKCVSYGIKDNEVLLQGRTFIGSFNFENRKAMINHNSSGHNSFFKIQTCKKTYCVDIDQDLIDAIKRLEESNNTRSNYNADETVTMFG